MSQAALQSWVRRLVPEELRIPMWRFRKRVLDKVTSEHEWRWWMSSARSLEEYVDKTLDLGEHYWLFVLGLNNSGTTLLVRLLESHPLVRALPAEGQFVTNVLPRSGRFGVRRLWGLRPDVFHWTERDHPARALRAKYDWTRWYPRRPGILLEKTPANSMRSRWLQAHFKPSRFLAIVRSPYAVCEGIRRRANANIEDAARHWSNGNARLFEDMEKLERCLWFRYEDLCAEPLVHLERFERFLDLAPGSLDRRKLEDLDVHNMENTVGKAWDTGGKTAPLRDFNAKSLERLSRQDLDTITRICSKEMERIGYAPL